MASAPAGATSWGVMWEQANALVQSGFLPPAIKTAEQAIAIMLTGDELGIPKMLALRSIHVIQGRPTLSADLMASLVQREIDRHGDGEFRVLPPDAQSCTVKYRRWGWSEGHSYTYTIEDASRANLTGKDTWKAHPAAMLRARATAAVCRMAFPDVIAGMYDPEDAEAGAYADIDEAPRLAVIRSGEDSPSRFEQWSTSDADAVEAEAVEAEREASQPPPPAPIETAPPSPLEQQRLDLWAYAKDLGFSWDAFNVLRRECGVRPALEAMTASQLRLLREELDRVAKEGAEMADDLAADDAPEQDGLAIDAEYVERGEPGLDSHTA